MRWLIWTVLASAAAAGVRERGAELEAAHLWEEAVHLYRSALDDLPAGDTDTRLWLLTSLAEVEFNRQEYGAAERWLHQAGQLPLPGNSPESIRLMTARGTLYLVRGNLTAAERELARALELTASTGLPEDRAARLHNLAAVEMHTGRLDVADAHEREALQIWRDLLGDSHEYVLKAWISLSSLQGLRGDWPAAEESLRRALAIRESDEALANYAVVLEKLKRRNEAKAVRARLHGPMIPAPSLLDRHSVSQSIRTR
jgi:tetratricopeptide (TPR) repeat protein